jgi:hypothetical protein
MPPMRASASAVRLPAVLGAAQADGHAYGLGPERCTGLQRNVSGAEQGAVTWI